MRSATRGSPRTGAITAAVLRNNRALAYPDALVGIHLTDVPYLNLVRFTENMSKRGERGVKKERMVRSSPPSPKRSPMA